MNAEKTHPDTDVGSPPVLDYGQQSSLRRRVRNWGIVGLILAAIGGGLWFAVPNVIHAIKLKAAIAECNAWASTARTSVLPEGTLLYAESISDRAHFGNRIGTIFFRIYGDNNQPAGIVTGTGFSHQHSLLHEISYLEGGIPSLSDWRNIIYVHEHPLWLAPQGSPPPVFSVYYIGTSSSGNPQFGVTSRMFPLDSKGQSKMVGGIAIAPLPGRPLTNLRLFAGQPNPTDPTRFYIPFSCDAGSGRFEFQTDTDASDGGDVVPRVTIAWDPTPTNQPE